MALSEPEINERVEAGGGNGAQADYEKEDAERTHQNNGFVPLFFGKQAFLPPFDGFKSSPEGENDGNDQNCIEFAVEIYVLAAGGEEKHLFQVSHSLRQGIGPEKHPAYQDDNVGDDDTGQFPDCFIEF